MLYESIALPTELGRRMWGNWMGVTYRVVAGLAICAAFAQEVGFARGLLSSIILAMEVHRSDSPNNPEPDPQNTLLSAEHIRRLEHEFPGFIDRAANHLEIVQLFLNLPRELQRPVARALASSIELARAELAEDLIESPTEMLTDHDINRKVSSSLYKNFGNTERQRDIDTLREAIFGIIMRLARFSDLESMTLVTEDLVSLSKRRE